MATAKTNRDSWLRLTVFHDIDVEPRLLSAFSMAEYPEIKDQDDDLIHTARTVDRPDLLAFNYYGTVRLWWVIAVKNGWDQPLTAINPGDEVIIPSPRYVRETLVR